MNKLAWAVALLLLSPAIIFSQSSDSVYENEWRMFHYGLNHSGATASSAPTAANFAWKVPIRVFWCSAAVKNGVVFISAVDGGAYALNASTGAQIWNYPMGGSSGGSPAIADGVVYFGSDDNRTYALNASTGVQIWNYTTRERVFSSPAVANGIVYVGSDDYYFYALNATIGAQVWNFTQNATQMTAWYIGTSPAVVNGVVYFGASSYFFNGTFALNASTGAPIWNQSMTTGTYSSPAVVDGVVYIGEDSGIVYALNASTGAQVWNHSIGGARSSPAVVYGMVYIGSGDNYIHALNASTGTQIWNYSAGNWVLSSPAVAGGMVFIGSVDRKLYALNAFNGQLVWSYSSSGAVWSSPAIADGMLFFGTDSGSRGDVYAFGPAPPWNGNLTGQLNVSQTCGSEINATALNFGSLVPGQTSSQQSLLLTNIGSWNTTDITIDGTDWISTPTVNFTANYTKWSNETGFAYASGNSMTNSPASMNFNLTNNQTKDVFFRVQIPLGQATATYTQNITITTIC